MGAKLLFAIDGRIECPERPVGCATAHDCNTVHGVSCLTKGVRYSLFAVFEAASDTGRPLKRLMIWDAMTGDNEVVGYRQGIPWLPVLSSSCSVSYGAVISFYQRVFIIQLPSGFYHSVTGTKDRYHITTGPGSQCFSGNTFHRNDKRIPVQ